MLKKKSENKKLKAAEVRVESPLPHRPGILKVTLPSGRVVTDRLDDKGFLDGEERAAIYGPPRSPVPRPKPLEELATPEELARLEAARVAAAETVDERNLLYAEARAEAEDGIVNVRPNGPLAEADERMQRARGRVRNLERGIRRAAQAREDAVRPCRVREAEMPRFAAVGLGEEAEAIRNRGEYGALCEELRRREAGELESAEVRIAQLEAKIAAMGGAG